MAEIFSPLKIVLTMLLPPHRGMQIDPTGREVYYQIFLGFRMSPGMLLMTVCSVNFFIPDDPNQLWDMDHTSNMVLLGTKIYSHRTRANNLLYRYNGPVLQFLDGDFFSFELVNIQVTGHDDQLTFVGLNNTYLIKYREALHHSNFIVEYSLGARYANNRELFLGTYDIAMPQILVANWVDLDNAHPNLIH